jgi:hypothetical protein
MTASCLSSGEDFVVSITLVSECRVSRICNVQHSFVVTDIIVYLVVVCLSSLSVAGRM